jgi:hypothetical protein
VANKGHSEQQTLRALRQAEGGARVAYICREHGVSCDCASFGFHTKSERHRAGGGSIL